LRGLGWSALGLATKDIQLKRNLLNASSQSLRDTIDRRGQGLDLGAGDCLGFSLGRLHFGIPLIHEGKDLVKSLPMFSTIGYLLTHLSGKLFQHNTLSGEL
jgi:hypothetical protein